jgi:hypothetical protein
MKKIQPPVLEFAKETVDKIEELINHTKKKEIGGLLCLDVNNKIYIEQIKEGSETELFIPTQCKENMSPIGTFHTHPLGEIERISSSDYERATQDFITCVGQKINNINKIKCLIPLRLNDKQKKEREELISELSEIDFLINLGYSKEEVEDKINKSKIRNKLDTYFNWLRIP